MYNHPTRTEQSHCTNHKLFCRCWPQEEPGTPWIYSLNIWEENLRFKRMLNEKPEIVRDTSCAK